MKVYKVEVTEILQRVVLIEANSEVEAEHKAKEMYDKEDITLSYENFIETEFKCL